MTSMIHDGTNKGITYGSMSCASHMYIYIYISIQSIHKYIYMYIYIYVDHDMHGKYDIYDKYDGI